MRLKLSNHSSYLIVLILSLTFQYHTVLGQNIIPNPSFEDILRCPDDNLMFEKYDSDIASGVKHWFNPTEGTCDYFNYCSENDFFNVPNNWAGKQYPFEGDGYAGILTYQYFPNTGKDYREYIMVELQKPMNPLDKYYFGMYFIPAHGIYENDGMLSVDQIGAVFTPEPININTTEALTNFKTSISTPPNIFHKNENKWHYMDGEFLNAKNSKYITIGTFLAGSQLHVEPLSDNISPMNMAYYFIDNLCLLNLSSNPYSSQVHHDTIFCYGDEIKMGTKKDLKIWNWNIGGTYDTIKTQLPGTYWVQQIDTINCRIFVDTYHVTNISYLDQDILKDTLICKGDSITFKDNMLEPVAIYWSNNTSKRFLTPSDTGTYHVFVTDGCKYTRDTLNIDFYDIPYFDLGKDTFLCVGNGITIGTEFIDSFDYLWNNGKKESYITVYESGLYTLTVSNTCKQSHIDSINLLINYCPSCLLIPNAFSPNNDGLNDQFEIKNLCAITTFEMKIYDRYGGLVYQSWNIKDKWDGKYNNQLANPGVYYYYIYTNNEYNEPEIYKGDITLIR